MSAPASHIYVRAATAQDQAAIQRLIRAARLNPIHIAWPNFLVAEQVQAGDQPGAQPGARPGARQLVGVGQIKPHDDGSRELASIAVAPEYQRLGIAAVIIHALLAREQGDLYLYCGDTMPAYYVRFGFVEVGARDLPADIGRWFRLGQWAVALMATLLGETHALHAMHRPATPPALR